MSTETFIDYKPQAATLRVVEQAARNETTSSREEALEPERISF